MAIDLFEVLDQNAVQNTMLEITGANTLFHLTRAGLVAGLENYKHQLNFSRDVSPDRLTCAIARLRMEECQLLSAANFNSLRNWPDNASIFLRHPRYGTTGFLHVATLLDHLDHDWKDTSWF